MAGKDRLQRDFYARETTLVARDLLGCRLVRLEKQKGKVQRISGIITETEAYCGESDLGCHAKAGRTPRTEVLYGPAGISYVYFTYGNHWLLCAVTRPEGEPEAVLIRAIEVDEGLDTVKERRGHIARKHWTDGPGKLTQALAIRGEHNKVDLCESKAIIFIENGPSIPDSQVRLGPRIGLYTVPEPWKSMPWRNLADLKTS
jgi:DNA-3-methyladenine glycosylase